MNLFRLQKNILNVPMGGIEPPSEGYESSALTIELHRQKSKQEKSVAGPGFAPGSRGYGPREILLLHPAVLYFISFSIFFKRKLNFQEYLFYSFLHNIDCANAVLKLKWLKR